MQTFVSLLRGINVGGNRKVPMGALRELYLSLGLTNPRTYINSGNVIFGAGRRDLAALALEIEDALEGAFGFRPTVILRTPAEIESALRRNPFTSREGIDPARLLITFLGKEPAEALREKVRGMVRGPEELFIDGREMYVYFPDGMGQTKLPAAAIEKTLGGGTARNRNTVEKLLELAKSGMEMRR